MHTLSKISLLSMLNLQDQLNTRTQGADWREKKNNWARAVWVEAAEGLDHIGWKWWKQQPRNTVQAQIELVDIWHFTLSDALENATHPDRHRNGESAAVTILLSLEDMAGEFDVMGQKFRVQDLTMQQLFDKLAGFAGFGYIFVPALAELMHRLGMTWSTVERMYVAKNVLNMFRQDHGYGDGTYVKTWGIEEDNVYLEKLMDMHPNATPAVLLAMLTARYAEVVA